MVSIFSQNVDVLPPGHGRAVGVDVVGFMPVGRDVLFGWLDECDNDRQGTLVLEKGFGRVSGVVGSGACGISAGFGVV
jgi:hypothetical protein